jgi:hypothetical protein
MAADTPGPRYRTQAIRPTSVRGLRPGSSIFGILHYGVFNLSFFRPSEGQRFHGVFKQSLLGFKARSVTLCSRDLPVVPCSIEPQLEWKVPDPLERVEQEAQRGSSDQHRRQVQRQFQRIFIGQRAHIEPRSDFAAEARPWDGTGDGVERVSTPARQPATKRAIVASADDERRSGSSSARPLTGLQTSHLQAAIAACLILSSMARSNAR